MNYTSLPGLISSDDLSRLNTRDTIIQIKTAAIRQFEALDARMHIHNTQYFNHSFAPDLVLRWSRGSPGERYVFMRSSSQDEVLVDDVARLGDLKPIILALASVQGETEQKTTESLSRLTYEKDTLVTDPTALAKIGEVKRDRPVINLFSTALTQGGRGLLDGDDARKAAILIADGLNGARQIKPDLVSRAAATAENYLSAPFANRFHRLLRAVWITSGGRADLFPYSQTQLSASMDDDALEYLLEQEPYDAGSGLERLVTWVAEDTPLSASQPRRRGRRKETSASSAQGSHAYSRSGSATETPLSDVRFLTVAQVATIMRVSKMTVYALVHSGDLEAIRVGRSFRIPEQAVSQYMRAAYAASWR